jgi:Ser/Thr protein kinase RdoA (MazF antagonist)
MTIPTAGAAERVLDSYPLERPVVLHRDDVGVINDNWLVEDAAGTRYVLRAYRRVRDPARIAFQLAFQEHLWGAGFATAPVVQTREGAPYAEDGGLYWALFGFVDGVEFDFQRLEQAREAGARLAQFQALAESFAGPVADPPTEVVGPANWSAPVSSHVWRTSILDEEHEVRLRELLGDGSHDDGLTYYSRWRREAASAWPLDRLAALPVSWLHCDYHGRNMLFQQDRLVGLFDFDFLARGPRTFDLGRAVFNFGRESRGSVTLRDGFVEALMAGFVNAAALTAEERRAMPFMAVANWVPDAAFYLARSGEPGDPGLSVRFNRDIVVMRAVEQEVRRLAPRLGWGAA